MEMEKLSEAQMDKDFNTQDAMEFIEKAVELSVALEEKFSIFKSSGTFNNDVMLNLICGRLHNKISKAKFGNLLANPVVYTVLCRLYESMTDLKPHQAKLVRDLLACSSLAGTGYGVTTHDIRSTVLFQDLPKHIRQAYFPTSYLNASIRRDKQRFENFVDRLSLLQFDFNRLVLATSVASSISSRHTSAHEGLSVSPAQSANLSLALELQPVSELDLASSAPNWLPITLGGSSLGGHIIGMNLDLSDDSSANLLLRHCINRELRSFIWKNMNNRASLDTFGGSAQHASTNSLIDDIRRCAQNGTASLSLQDKPKDYLHAIWQATKATARVPKSPQWLVDEVLEPLRESLSPQAHAEWALLKEWSKGQLDINDGVQQWDIDYAIEQFNYFHSIKPGGTLQRNSNTAFIHSVDSILPKIIQLFSYFFPDLNLELASSGVCSKLLSPQVSAFCRVIKVTEKSSSQLIGEVLLDLVNREKKGNFIGFSVPGSLTGRSNGQPAIAAVVAKLKHEDPEVANSSERLFSEQLLTLENALSICGSVATCLQHVTNRNPYYSHFGMFTSPICTSNCLPLVPQQSATSDLRSMLLDVSQYMFAPMLRTDNEIQQPQRVEKESVLQKKIERIIALPMMKLLMEARFDLALWSEDYREVPWKRVLQEMCEEHLPYKLDEHSAALNWPCSARHLFGTQAAPGTIYFQVLRHVLSQDVIAALNQVNGGLITNFDNPNLQAMLPVFCELLVRDAGFLSPNEAFEQFMGRQPDVKHLQQTIQNHAAGAAEGDPHQKSPHLSLLH
ncbi:hypothetical protein Ciccas_000115 [Cichlidogyrus casuarinus]|uniref:Uncharacterized protein n=1 Tax=Cichlidogyrus casuarinus TaxID=1844966 RepID=A0ABD2QNU5_9PLAT